MIDLLERAKILLKATKELLEKQENSFYVMNLLAETVFYDGVDCDGSCLKDDIGYWFDELEDAPPAKAISLDKVKKAREEIDDLDRYFDNDLYTDNTDSMFKCSEVLEILNKLIESEE